MSEPHLSDPELDPQLARFLQAREEAEGESCDLSAAELGDLFTKVEDDIEQAEKSRAFWFRSRPTWMRRLLAAAVAGVIFLVASMLVLREDLASYPTLRMVLVLSSMAVLLGLAIHQALRPLHRPPLPNLTRAVIIGATLTATCALALLPPPHPVPPVDRGTLVLHAMPCLMYGLLLGLPVYLALRVMSRGRNGAGSLLAACAAGLLGNASLQMHCPNNHPEHLLVGHFGVVVAFVGGLALIHLTTRAFFRESE
ncbi:MAG: NrsF family protein [Sandaracinaceae bacterium]